MLQNLNSEFLREIPPQLIPKIADLAQERDYTPGAVLFREGTVHPEFHLLIAGHVRLDMAVPQRGRIPLLTAGPGDVLAWSALVAQGKMTATATALDSVRTVAFDGEQLRLLCDQDMEVGYHVMKQLASAVSQRLLATRLQLLDLFAGHVPVMDARLAFGKPGDPEC